MREMTCREFDEIVHGFVRMELLDVNVREAALEHAARCPACAQRMSDAAVLAEASEAIGRETRENETPAHVETTLSFAFRSHHRRAAWRRRLEWASVGAAAAILLIFVWVSGWRQKSPAIPAPRKDVASQPSAPLDAAATAGAKQNQAVAEASADDTAASSASSGESTAVSDFVPVPFTGGITADDPGMIVRVQLTRASLAQLGYPVAETPDEDLILADVLVGEDGWPRGVKVVQ